MTPEQTCKLAAIANRYTRYELAAIKGDTRLRIAYTMHRSRHGLLAACRSVGPEVIKALGVTESAMMTFGKRAADGAQIGEWAIRFTGRTQREAILEGELVWVGTAAKAGSEVAA